MDRKTRKLLTMHGLHHPKGDVSRLYIKRCNGGRGLQLMSACSCSMVNLSGYIEQDKDRFCRLVKKKHEAGNAKYSLLKKKKAIKNKYLLLSTAQTIDNDAKGQHKEGEIRRTAGETNAWTFFCSLEKPFVVKEASCAWLRSAQMRN